MTRTGLLAVAAALIAGSALAQPAAPIPTQSPQPSLVKLLPPETKSFTLAVSIGSPPDDFRDAGGQIVGWEVDIMRAATEALGLSLDLRPTTFDTLIPGLQARRFDGGMGQMGITDARLKVLDMVSTLKANELFAALADSAIKVDTLEDVCGLTAGTTRGSREMVFAADEAPKCEAAGKKPINALAFVDGNAAAEALMSRRIDLFWFGSTAVSYFVGQSQGRVKVVGHYTDPSYIGVALPKGSPLAEPLRAAIQFIMDNGTYGRIVQKWGLQDSGIKQALIDPAGTPN